MCLIICLQGLKERIVPLKGSTAHQKVQSVAHQSSAGRMETGSPPCRFNKLTEKPNDICKRKNHTVKLEQPTHQRVQFQHGGQRSKLGHVSLYSISQSVSQSFS